MSKNEQGLSNQRYQVIPRTLIFLFNEKDEVLLFKAAPDKKIWPNRYNGVGGHIERGESVYFAAKRELFEEVGVEGIHLDYCGNVLVDVEDDKGVTVFVFTGEIENLPDNWNSNEGCPEWHSMDQLKELALVPDIPFILAEIKKQRRGDPPFFAKSYYNENGQLTIEFDRE
jgi:8-oxo-dGTP diphosphatase